METQTAPQIVTMPKGFVPDSVYTVCLESVKQDPSKSGLAMDCLSWHIVAPAEALVKRGNGYERYKVAGLSGRTYCAYSDNDFFPGTCAGLAKLGVVIPMEGTFAEKVAAIQSQTKDLSPGYVKGQTQPIVVFEALVTSKPEFMPAPLLTEDVLAGKTEPGFLRDAQGNPVIRRMQLDLRIENVVGNFRQADNIPY